MQGFLFIFGDAGEIAPSSPHARSWAGKYPVFLLRPLWTFAAEKQPAGKAKKIKNLAITREAKR